MVPLELPRVHTFINRPFSTPAPIYTTAVHMLPYFKNANQLGDLSLMYLNEFTNKANCEQV
jgi:hypothetical protein